MSRRGAVVKLGTFLYAGTVECDVRIVLSPIHYGTGDYEDAAAIREDREESTFYVEFGSTSERGVFNSASVGYASLAAAEAGANAALGSGASVIWSDVA